MTQVIARVPEDLAAAVDRLVADGVFGSRSDVVREALAQLVDRHRRAEVGRQIVAGYERMPETPEEIAWADESTRRLISDEPW